MTLSRRHLLQSGLGASLLAGIAGCSLGSTAPRLFSLTPLAGPPAAAGPDWSLAVVAPRALTALDSDRIAHRPGKFELQYYAGVNWVDHVPQMLQMIMIRSLQNCTHLQVVPSDLPGPLPDFQLTSTLQDFQSEQRDSGQVVHVALMVMLASRQPRHTAQSRLLESTVMVAHDDMDGVVAAFDDAVHQTMTELIGWTLAAGARERAMPTDH